MSSYLVHSRPALQRMCKNRGLGLGRSATKAQLAAALDVDDIARPFPVFELPAELRTMIYSYVALQEVPRETEGRTYDEVNKENITQPALIRTCKLAREEGLDIFYQYHNFVIRPFNWDCVMHLFDWLDEIGPANKQNIRFLTLRLGLGGRLTPSLPFMKRLHAQLSDQAALAYVGNAFLMRAIGERFLGNNPNKELLFGDGVACWVFMSIRTQAFSHWDYVALIFGPGNSWFGRPAPIMN